ncbi:MAG TPA: hypothetical protein VK787_15590, partial [Puia sp.]|nr:hypothetical protein [Puia sp.]
MKTSSPKPNGKMSTNNCFENKFSMPASFEERDGIIRDLHSTIYNSSSSADGTKKVLSSEDLIHITPQAILISRTTNTNGSTNKNSFMKTFLQKSGILAIAFLVASLFLVSNAIGQTTQT